MDPMFGSIMQSASDLTTSGMNLLFTREANKAQRKYGREMAEYAYSKDLEMWNRANEYNTPEAQMQRFKDAGLNPRLIYGQGNPGNAVSQSPKYSPPEGKFGGWQMERVNFMSTYMDLKMKSKQLEIMEANKKQIEANTGLKGLMSEMAKINLGFRPQEIEQIIKGWPHQLDAIKLKPGLMEAQMQQIAEQMNLTVQQRKWIEKKIQTFDESGGMINIDASSTPNLLLKFFYLMFNAVSNLDQGIEKE